MEQASPRVIHVRQGLVEPSGSWLYVWIDVNSHSVEYVGGTGFDPELRTHLHLTSDEPEVGRVRARVRDVAERDFDVLAFELPETVSRSSAKEALTERLTGSGAMSSDGSCVNTAVNPIAESVENYLRHLER